MGVDSLAVFASPLWAQAPQKGKLAPKLRIVIPAMARSSLDDAGRALGDALTIAGVCDEVEYENRDGRGGTAGLAYYADKYSRDPNTLLMGDSSLVGAIALHKPVVDLNRVLPVARLASDYLVLVVAAASPLKTVAEVSERLRNNVKQMPIAIGALGGVEHVFAGLLAKSAGTSADDVMYQLFARRFEMVDAVLSGKARAAISGFSTFNADIASGKLRAIGVSSRRSAYGLKSMREQGMDVDMTNWRAAFTGREVPPARQAEMVEAFRTVASGDSWKKSLKDAYWEPSWLVGPDLAGFIDIDMKTALLMTQLLKLKA